MSALREKRFRPTGRTPYLRRQSPNERGVDFFARTIASARSNTGSSWIMASSRGTFRATPNKKARRFDRASFVYFAFRPQLWPFLKPSGRNGKNETLYLNTETFDAFEELASSFGLTTSEYMNRIMRIELRRTGHWDGSRDDAVAPASRYPVRLTELQKAAIEVTRQNRDAKNRLKAAKADLKNHTRHSTG